MVCIQKIFQMFRKVRLRRRWLPRSQIWLSELYGGVVVLLAWSGRLTCLPCLPRKIDLDGDGTLTEEEFVGVREGLQFAGG